MKRILYIPICLLIAALFSELTAQQDAQYTNFMFNKLALNPAFAGAREAASFSALYRDQWHGFEGAPNSQIINFHTPLDYDRMGVGLNLERDALGFTENWKIGANYAYRFQAGPGKLALGLSASARYYRVDWTKADPTQLNDLALPAVAQGKMIPNFGIGAFYHTDSYYIGLSVPHLLAGDLSFQKSNGQIEYAKEELHSYLMAGIQFPISEQVKLSQNILYQYAANAPATIDANLNFIFFDKLTVGGMYRVGDSFDALVHYYINQQLHIGLAYDIALTEMRRYNDGTFEIFVGYELASKAKRIYNPRFFF